MKLNGTRAVITGGTRGLGKALVKRFLAEGAAVAACARSSDALNRMQVELSAAGGPLLALQCDVAEYDQVAAFSEKVVEEFGGVDVLVNNASMLGPRSELFFYTRATWERVIDVNVNGVFYVTKALLGSMIGRRGGSIINVSSSVGRTGRARWGAYAVSKFAIEGFTQVLAEELREFGIRVNSVNPGAMATEMRRAAYPEEDQSTLRQPEDVTDVFVYLASDQSRGITGQTFDAQKFQIP